MLFNSLEYLIFLPIVFFIYWWAMRCVSTRACNLVVVAASYIFYSFWSAKFLVLIMFTTLCSYVFGLLISRTQRPLLYVWINVLINLGILGVYKYYDFFIPNFVALMSHIGLHPGWVTLNLVLPVGISFYTFQALSYTIDVYRRTVKPTRDIVAFTAFISFFPQLVAGPIERANNLLPQFLKPRRFDYAQAVEGMRQILWGLFKKMVVADNCAKVVNVIFADYEQFNSIVLIYGAVLFTFQIYGDFSGYSDIAIGTAKLFNIKLMNNFRTPFFSRDIAEFWRRWHISLSSWFRDYVYIPLGGSRCSKGKVIRNTFVIFLLSGFWHGANWTFIAWGGYHAALFMPLILRKKNRRYTDTVAAGRLLPSFYDGLSIFVTFCLVAIGFVIFRSVDMHQAMGYILHMFNSFGIHSYYLDLVPVVWICVLIVVEWLNRQADFALSASHGGWIWHHRIVRWGAYVLLFMICLWGRGESEQFIYFQF